MLTIALHPCRRRRPGGSTGLAAPSRAPCSVTNIERDSDDMCCCCLQP